MQEERKRILRFVQKSGDAHFAALMRHLELPASRKTALRRALRDMEREGAIVKNKGKSWSPAQDTLILEGTFTLAQGGYGFVAIAGEEGFDVFVPRHKVGSACTGDRVKAREEWRQAGRRSGAVVAVTERAVTRVAGELQRTRDGLTFVWGEGNGIPGRVLVEPDQLDGARAGQRVGIELTGYPDSETNEFRGRVVEIFDASDTVTGAIAAVVFEKQLREEFPPDVVAEAARLGSEVREGDKRARKDLRALPFVTIDGEDARDFDDAVCIVEEGGKRVLYVAIADVAHYVAAGSPLDLEARARGTSTYFPTRVLPMLPEAISNGLCSLRPDEDRLALVAELQLDPDTRVKRYRFLEATIRSHARLTYTQVQRFLDGEPETEATPAPALRPMLRALRQVADVLLRERVRDGSLDLEIPEPYFRMSEDGEQVLAVELRSRTGATGLVEELMLLANKVVAHELVRRELPGVFRVHDDPDPQKVQTFLRLARMFEPELVGELDESPKPGELQAVIAQVRDPLLSRILQIQLLRAMAKARYSAACLGHYGLGFEEYLHFTSPIRRYPDLVVHRLTKRFLLEGATGEPSEALFRDLGFIADEASLAERRSMEAEREVDDLLKSRFMENRVGASMPGVVAAVTPSGLFVSLDGLPIEGFLRVEDLPSDDYRIDDRRYRLVARYSGDSVGLGDRLRVTVAGASMGKRHIDLVLAVDDEAEGEAGGLRHELRRRVKPLRDGTAPPARPRPGTPKRGAAPKGGAPKGGAPKRGGAPKGQGGKAGGRKRR